MSNPRRSASLKTARYKNEFDLERTGVLQTMSLKFFLRLCEISASTNMPERWVFPAIVLIHVAMLEVNKATSGVADTDSQRVL